MKLPRGAARAQSSSGLFSSGPTAKVRSIGFPWPPAAFATASGFRAPQLPITAELAGFARGER